MHQTELYRKTVVITGASSGAGRAIALAFAREGAHLVLAARREAALNEVARLCDEMGAKATVFVCDVTDAAAVKNLAQTAFTTYGSIDVWVNNAGVLAAGTFEETPIEVHDQVVRTNLMGYMHGAHAVIPFFKKQEYGVLINNISVGGWLPTPYAVGYTASKFGLRGFAQALRGELHRFPHIHVCDAYPAFLDTPGIQHAANYTGRYLKPAPPVYDPQRLAAALVQLAKNPRNSIDFSVATTVLKTAHGLLPGVTRKMTALLTESYLKNARPLPDTEGNLFTPQEFGTGIHGGWNSPADARQRKRAGMMVLAGFALGWLLLGRRS